MNKIRPYILYSIILGLILTMNSCTKEVFELATDQKILENNPVPGDSTGYFPEIGNNNEYYVELNGKPLQIGDKAEWKVKSGRAHSEYVRFGNKNNPITKFYGIPGEKYVLEWVVNRKDKELKEEVTVQIKEPPFVIENFTPSTFKTKIHLRVYQHLQGKWTFNKGIAYINPLEHSGGSQELDGRTSVEIQGFENTEYHIKWTYTLFDKEFELDTVIKTGQYTQEEALADLGFSPHSRYVTWNNKGEVVEINMHSNGRAFVFDEWKRYPTLVALKHLQKLNVSSSSLNGLPEIFTQHYLELEELNMGSTGYKVIIPESIKNLKKLKKFRWSNLYGSHVPLGQIYFPEEFGELESLEELHTRWEEGIVLPRSFSKLKNLKIFSGFYQSMPKEIGNLKKLTDLEATFRDGEIAPSISQATSLKRIMLHIGSGSTKSLPQDFGNLKNLSYLGLLGSGNINNLPDSFSELEKLDSIWSFGPSVGYLGNNFGNLKKISFILIHTSADKLPESFGNLSNLKFLSITGKNLKSVPESFGKLQSLTYLSLNSGLYSLPKSFSSMVNLKEINLEQNNLSSLPESFSELKAHQINLSKNKFTEFPLALTKLKETVVLILDDNNIKMLPDEVIRLKGLVSKIDLHQNFQIPIENLKSIAKQMPGTIISRNEFSSWQIF